MLLFLTRDLFELGFWDAVQSHQQYAPVSVLRVAFPSIKFSWLDEARNEARHWFKTFPTWSASKKKRSRFWTNLISSFAVSYQSRLLNCYSHWNLMPVGIDWFHWWWVGVVVVSRPHCLSLFLWFRFILLDIEIDNISFSKSFFIWMFQQFSPPRHWKGWEPTPSCPTIKSPKWFVCQQWRNVREYHS